MLGQMINISSSPSKTEKVIKTICAAFLTLALFAVVGCRTNVSAKGGVVPLNEEFSITVPTSETLKQGTTSHATVVLKRGPYFKRDVELQIKAMEGITVTPHYITLKASDKPEVVLQIEAAREAAIGEYRVTVTGTPESGKPTATAFVVKVTAQ
jgi:hypothetical protein